MSKQAEGQLHVFAGTFSSREEACEYTEEQWEPEPDESVSDEEYEKWENRNPHWAFREDLGVYLEHDFIETIDGENRFEYLETYIIHSDDMENIRQKAGDSNILVLLFPEAIDEDDQEDLKLKDTPKLIYCGSFDFTMGD